MPDILKETSKGTKIEKIMYFSCGYCTSQMKMLFRGSLPERRKFPAGVFLLKHREKGHILYDTGYGTEILGKRWKYRLYNIGTPVTVRREDIIDSQLEKVGIGKDEIRHIILSHLHPDHIGGLKYIENAEIIMTEKCYRTYRKKSLRNLIFKEFFPDDFLGRLKIIEDNQDNIFSLGEENRNVEDNGFGKVGKSYGNKEGRVMEFLREGYDLFGDGSIIITSLDGHAEGQACIYIPERALYIAADTCWGTDLLPLTGKMKMTARMVQHSFKEYMKGTVMLERLIGEGITVLVSHDREERIREILNEKEV